MRLASLHITRGRGWKVFNLLGPCSRAPKSFGKALTVVIFKRGGLNNRGSSGYRLTSQGLFQKTEVVLGWGEQNVHYIRVFLLGALLMNEKRRRDRVRREEDGLTRRTQT